MAPRVPRPAAVHFRNDPGGLPRDHREVLTGLAPRSPAEQPVHGGRAGKQPEGDDRVADGASERRIRRERDYRVPVEVVQRVPDGMQKPSGTDKTVRRQPPEGAEGNRGGEDELPYAEATAQVRRARPRKKDGVEVLAGRPPQQGGERDAPRGGGEWRQH